MIEAQTIWKHRYTQSIKLKKITIYQFVLQSPKVYKGEAQINIIMILEVIYIWHNQIFNTHIKMPLCIMLNTKQVPNRHINNINMRTTSWFHKVYVATQNMNWYCQCIWPQHDPIPWFQLLVKQLFGFQNKWTGGHDITYLM